MGTGFGGDVGFEKIKCGCKVEKWIGSEGIAGSGDKQKADGGNTAPSEARPRVVRLKTDSGEGGRKAQLEGEWTWVDSGLGAEAERTGGAGNGWTATPSAGMRRTGPGSCWGGTASSGSGRQGPGHPETPTGAVKRAA